LGHDKEVIDLLSPLQVADPENRAFDYLLGTALVRDGQAAKGQVIIDRILRNGDSAEARLLMGMTKSMVKDYAGALAEFQKAIDLNPELPDLYSYYGLALLTTGDQAGARKAFEQELQRNPNNFDANLRMGVLLRQDQANDEALKFLRHALQVRPGDFGVRYQIACIELAKRELEPAQRDLEALVREAPEFTEAHVTLATVYFRQKKKVEGDRERAIVMKLTADRQALEPGAHPVQ
jgi:tetratricopeptide (TPR) repeat protein